MNDDTAVAAIATEVPEETPAPAPQAPKPKRKSRAKAVLPAEKEPETPRAEREREPDPMLFAMLLKTQRAMEKEARTAKLSSLRIV